MGKNVCVCGGVHPHIYFKGKNKHANIIKNWGDADLYYIYLYYLYLPFHLVNCYTATLGAETEIVVKLVSKQRRG